MSYPNAYPGADPEFARFTNFDSSGAVTGGFGFESVVTVTSHSSYNALQTSLSGMLGMAVRHCKQATPGANRWMMSAALAEEQDPPGL